MSTPERVKRLLGQWTGTNRLWLTPDEPAHESTTEAVVKLVGAQRFLTLEYTWSHGGEQRDGLLLVGRVDRKGVTEATWLDSFHQSAAMMHCTGDIDAAGAISVSGAYPAPPGPDWGWRIEVRPDEDGAFAMRMYNIHPDGEEDLAVEATYERLDFDAL